MSVCMNEDQNVTHLAWFVCGLNASHRDTFELLSSLWNYMQKSAAALALLHNKASGFSLALNWSTNSPYNEWSVWVSEGRE